MSKEFVLELGEERRIPSTTVKELLVAVLEHGRQFRFRAAGMSMFPFIRSGDVVTVSPLKRGEPRIGDVVAFLQVSDRSLTLHRVVGAGRQTYEIRGDSAIQSDGKIPGKNILGRVVKAERNGSEVRLGFGSEGRAIAVLSRWGILERAISLILKILMFLRRMSPRPIRPVDDNHEGT
jgi:signal peptidase I